MTPLALVSVGYQLRLDELRGSARELPAGLLFSFYWGSRCWPLCSSSACAARHGDAGDFVRGGHGLADRGAIVAMEHGLNPRLVSLMVGIGIPLSLLTATVWSRLLSGV